MFRVQNARLSDISKVWCDKRIQFKEHRSWFYGPVKSSELPTCLKYSRNWLDRRHGHMEYLSGLSLNSDSEVHWSVCDLFASLGWKFNEKVFPVRDLLLPLSCWAGNSLIRVSALAFQHFWSPPEHESAEADTNNGEERERKAFILAPFDFSDTDLLKHIPWNVLWGLELITLICC